MNRETLWNAIGEVGEDLILEAEKPIAVKRKNSKLVFLAAAIILLLSACTYAAAKWVVSFEDLFSDEVVKEYEQQPLNSSTAFEEGEITFSLVSALADERVFYLLYQVDGNGIILPPDCTIFPEITFTEGAVDSGLGWRSSIHIRPDEAVNSITGYLVSGWNSEMQHSKGTVHLDHISIPSSKNATDFPVDIPSVIAQSEYVESEYRLREGFTHKYFAEYQWLDVLAYDKTYIDLAVYENGILTVVTRVKRGEVETALTPQLCLHGKPLEILASATFIDKNGYFFNTTEYRVEEKDLPDLFYRRKEGTIYEHYIDGDWSLDFDIRPTMKSTVLKTANPDIEILCSKISMSISGDLPEFESLTVTLKDGTDVMLSDLDPKCVIFTMPTDPGEIASIKYNGVELLA